MAQNKAGKPTRQSGWSMNVPTLTAIIFASATIIANIHNTSLIRLFFKDTYGFQLSSLLGRMASTM
jgi:hypothetical protein